MGQNSQAGYVALRTQSAGGTFPADFNTNAIAMKLRTGGIGITRELMIPDPEIGGGRDIADAYLGAVSWGGDLEFYTRVNGLLTVLYGALGIKYVKTPGGTSHVTVLTMTGAPTGGTFTLTYSAQTTAALPYNASAGQVQAALEALSNIGEGEVDVSGGPINSAPINISWRGTLVGVVTNPTANSGGLTGGTTPTITPTSGTVGADYTTAVKHTFIPSDGAQLPFIGIQERIGASLETFNYTDAVINTLHFEADADGYLMGTAGVIARLQEAGITGPADIASRFDNLPMIVGTNIQVTYNNVSLPAKSFSFDLNNNFEDDDFRLGSFTMGDLTPKRREVTLGATIREQDSALWRQAAYGSSVATTPGGLSFKAPMKIVMSTYEVIPGEASRKFALTLDFPQVALNPYALEASGDDIIESDLEFQALRPDPARKLMYAEVDTNITAVA
jgi:hypothetical protein